jgi:Flp pilus assembly protein TadG
MTARPPPTLAADTRGATATEFALVATAFLVLVFGAIEFARYLWTREALQDTAMAGARCMGVLSSSCASGGAISTGMTTSYIQGVASSYDIALPSAAITLSGNATCGGVTGFSQVSISFAFSSVLPGFVQALGAGQAVSLVACFPNQPQ